MLGNFFGPSGRLKTLLDRLTTTRAANLDKLDANITTRAAASTALSNATWTDAVAGRIDAAVSSRAAESPALLPPMASGLVAASASLSVTALTYTSTGIPGYAVTSATAAQTTAYQSIVSVTGSGVLQLVSFGANNSTPTIRITIDGVVVLEHAASSTNTDCVAVGGYAYDSSVSRVVSLAFDSIPFRSQLLIEAKSAVATGNVTVRYKYRRTS